MPDFEVTDPSGKRFIVTAPDGATQEEVLAYAQSQFSQAPPPVPTTGQVARNAAAKTLPNLADTPLTLTSLLAKGAAALPFAGHFPGLQRLANEPELQARPAMDAAEALGVVNPAYNPQTGPQRVLDTAIQSGLSTALAPASSIGHGAKNLAVGATSGAVGQTTKEITKPIVGETGSTLLALGAGMLTPGAISLATADKKKVVATYGQKEVLSEAQRYGFKVEPSKVRTPSSTLESVAGKASIAQATVEGNQRIATGLASKSLGLPEATPLTPAQIQAVKNTAAQPYKELDQLFNQAKAAGTMPYFPRYHSQSLTDEWVAARQHASELWKSYWADPKIEIKRAAQKASAAVASVEHDIDTVAHAVGDPTLMGRLQAGRKLYARVNDVEEALNVGSYNISLPKLGRMVQDGRPLSDELLMMGRFAKAFPRSAREIEAIPPSGVSGTDPSAAAMLATQGADVAGGKGAIAGGLPLFRGPARRLVLSDSYQSKLLKPPKPPDTTSQTVTRMGLATSPLLNTILQPAPQNGQ